VKEESPPQQEITMTALPLRHQKLWAVLLGISVLTTLYNGTYLAFLAEWLPLIGMLLFIGYFITHVNRLKSLKLACKIPIFALGLFMIVWGISDFFGPHRSLLDLLHAAFVTAKSYFP
jgi:hypothetical protein